MTFKDFYRNKIGIGKIGTDKRHMHPVGRDASSHPKHPGRFVPHMHRTEVKNQKVEGLLRKTTGKSILNDAEVRQIEDEFNLKYSSTTPKKLGNTGISLRFDPVLGKPVLEK